MLQLNIINYFQEQLIVKVWKGLIDWLEHSLELLVRKSNSLLYQNITYNHIISLCFRKGIKLKLMI